MVNKKIRSIIKNDYDILNSLTENSDYSKIILMSNIIGQGKMEIRKIMLDTIQLYLCYFRICIKV